MKCDDTRSIRSSISSSIIKQQTEAYLENHVHVSFKSIIDSPGTQSPICVRKPSLSTELPESNTEYHLSKPGYSLLIEYQPATGQHPFFLQYTTSHAHHTFKGSSQQSPWCIQILPKGYRIYSNILRLHLHVSMQEISNYSFELTTNSMKTESFRAWQSSFLNGIQDLELTASEELDLLVLSSVYFLTPQIGP